MSIFGTFLEESYDGFIHEKMFGNNKAILDKLQKFVDKYKNSKDMFTEIKITKLINKIETLELSPEEKERFNNIKKEFKDINRAINQKRLLSELQETKKWWDTLDANGTWEGRNLEILYKLDISESKIISHFKNNKKLLEVSHVIRFFGESNIKFTNNIKPNDKAFVFYTNDDIVAFYDYNLNKSLSFDSDLEFEPVKIYDFVLDKDEIEKEDKDYLKELAKQNKIVFN